MGLDLDTDETFETEITRRDNPFRAYLTIIEGCDYACSYCVVPHTRGPERSRASDAVLAEARRLADAGYTEIQLLGQTVNSYRDPSPRANSILSICSAKSPRSREFAACASPLRTPTTSTREIVEAIDATPALCDHIHLPVQSGSTRILRAMRRTYTRDEYLEKIAWIRAARRAVQHHHRHHRRLSRRDGRGLRGIAHAARRGRLRRRLCLHIFAAPEYAGRHHARRHSRRGKERAASPSCRIASARFRLRATKSLIGQSSKCSSTRSHASRNQWAGRTTSNRIVNFTSPQRESFGRIRCR